MRCTSEYVMLRIALNVYNAANTTHKIKQHHQSTIGCSCSQSYTEAGPALAQLGQISLIGTCTWGALYWGKEQVAHNQHCAWR